MPAFLPEMLRHLQAQFKPVIVSARGAAELGWFSGQARVVTSVVTGQCG